MLKNRCQNFSQLTCQSWNFSRLSLRLTSCKTLVASSSRSSRDSSRDSLATRETPRNNFLKGFSWKTCFKSLPSSLKTLFKYFYIKTQSIWMVFHSINISKVILNSFHCFGSLDYVLGEFCALSWDFHHRGWETLIFVKFLYAIGFFWCLSLNVGPLWQKENVLRVDFMMFMHCFTLLFIVYMLGVW